MERLSTLSNSLFEKDPSSPFPPYNPIEQKNLSELFFHFVDSTPEATFAKYREIEDQIWILITWGEAGEMVTAIANHMRDELKIQAGERVGIISSSRLEWMLADLAILSIDAVSVPIYQTVTSQEAAYIIWDSEIQHIFAENEEQVQKLVLIDSTKQLIPKTPRFPGGEVDLAIKSVISFEKIENNYFDGRLKSFKEVCVDNQNNKRPTSQAKRGDLATTVYTSGTTGIAKGVMQTHENHIAMLDGVLQSGLVKSGKDIFLFLPLAHSFARLIGYCAIATGGNHIFPTVIDRKSSKFDAKQMFKDIKSSNPIIFPSVPRIFEKVMTALTDANGQSRRDKLVRWAVTTCLYFKEKKPTLLNRLKYFVAEVVVGMITQQTFGSKLSHCISGGAPLDPKVQSFFDALKITICEGYGLTETTPALTANTLQFRKIGTVGRPFEGITLKIAEDGEILANGGNIATGYWRLPEQTKEVFLEDGFLATGDIGTIDEEGFLSITDRKKEIIVNAGGKNIAPALVEGSIKTSPYISQVFAYGDRKPYLVALITLEFDNVIKWAEARKIELSKNKKEIAENEQVMELVLSEAKRLTEDLASYEQVKKIKILPEEFTIDNGFLTPTLKLKRKLIYSAYQNELESLYK